MYEGNCSKHWWFWEYNSLAILTPADKALITLCYNYNQYLSIVYLLPFDLFEIIFNVLQRIPSVFWWLHPACFSIFSFYLCMFSAYDDPTPCGELEYEQKASQFFLCDTPWSQSPFLYFLVPFPCVKVLTPYCYFLSYFPISYLPFLLLYKYILIFSYKMSDARHKLGCLLYVP